MSTFHWSLKDELVKQASHPLLKVLAKRGSFLGERLREGGRSKAPRKMKKKASEDALVKAILEAAKGSVDESDVQDTEMPGAEDTRYGGGLGNLGGKKAPKFTEKVNPTDMPGAFKGAMCNICKGKGCTACKAKQGTGCGPKYGCGSGKHGTGCGMAKKAGWVEDVLKKGSYGPREEEALARFVPVVRKRLESRDRVIKEWKAKAQQKQLKDYGKGVAQAAGGWIQRGASKLVPTMPKKKLAPRKQPPLKGLDELKRRAAANKGTEPQTAGVKGSLGHAIGGTAAQQMPASMTPSFAQSAQGPRMASTGARMPASMAPKKLGFGSAGQLKAPTMPKPSIA